MTTITDVEVGVTHKTTEVRKFDYGFLWVHRGKRVRHYALNNPRRFWRSVRLLKAFAKTRPFAGVASNG